MTIQPNSSLEQTVDIDHAAKLTTDTRQANWRRANPKKYAAHIAVQVWTLTTTIIRSRLPCVGFADSITPDFILAVKICLQEVQHEQHHGHQD